MIILVLLSLVLIGIAVALVRGGVMARGSAPSTSSSRSVTTGSQAPSSSKPPDRLPRLLRLRRVGDRRSPHGAPQHRQRGAAEERTSSPLGCTRHDAPEVIGYSLLFALGLPALGVWLLVAAGASGEVDAPRRDLLAAIGWVGPGFLVQQRAEGRLYRIDRAMPELIDLLVVTVEAGLSLSAALQLAGERMKGPLGDELRIVLQEQRMGLTPVRRSRTWSTRCPNAGGRVVRPRDGAGPAARRFGRGDPPQPRRSRCGSGAARQSNSRRRRRRSRCCSRSSS